MEEWQRSRESKNQYSSWSSPHPPPGPDHCSVPLWEKKFCSYVGGIPWQRFCESKKFISMSTNIDQWDDSAAFENFQNAKARFWAEYHGVLSDIPLPDRDMYIDKVDHYVIIDPELVADLEREQPAHDVNNSVPNSVDSFISANKSVPADGLGKREPNEKCSQNQSVNWDIYIEKPTEANKWEDNSKSRSSWGMKDEPRNAWNNNYPCWGEASPLMQRDWGCRSNNYYFSNNRNSSYGAANNRYNDPSIRNGRKRNIGGYFEARDTKQKYQADGYQTNNSWRDRRGRNTARHPFYKTAY